MSTTRKFQMLALFVGLFLSAFLFLALATPTTLAAATAEGVGLRAIAPGAPKATRTVTNTSDSGVGSLRAQIAAASSGDTIGFDAAVFATPVTITLSTGQIAIDKNLTIDATSVMTLSISGNNASRVFSVTAGVSVTLTKLSIVNGNCGGSCFGGGITNDGTLRVMNSTFSGNTATNGGAIWNNNQMAVTNGTFSGNTATENGGGIRNDGYLTVTDGAFSGNTASIGGGIYNYGALTATRITFSGNSATSGGGISNGFSLSVTDSTFSGNNATDGGGIANTGEGTANLTGSTFSGNSATQKGGGIYNHGELTVTNSTFSGNSAPSGGGIWSDQSLTVTNSTFSGNSASNSGAGIRNSSGLVTIRSTIMANSTVGGNCFGGVTDGGYNLDSGTSCGFSSANHSLSSTNPQLTPLGNYGGATQTFAILADSPAFNRIPSGTNGCGASIKTDQRGVSRPQVSLCDIGAYEWNNLVTNTNDSGEGSLRQVVQGVAPGDTVGFDGTAFGTAVTITLTSAQIAFDKNVAIDATSVAMPSISGDNARRVFWVNAGNTVTMTELAIVNGNCGSGCDGGGIWNGGTLTVISGTLRGNNGFNKGGGILNAGGATLTVTASTLSSNVAAGEGGGGIWNDSTLTLINSTLTGNSGELGGGIHNVGTVAVTSCTLSGNSATSGGAIRNSDGAATVKNTIIANSTSGGNCSITGGTLDDGGYNLDSGETCGFSEEKHSLVNTNPALAALGNYGGATQTMAILGTSPAVNKIPGGTNGCGTTVATDQRGVSRPQGTHCDIGAYEWSSIVKNTNNDGDGSLRQVIADAPAGDRILFDSAVFALPVTITLTSVQITLDRNVAIDAASVATPTISGKDERRVFWINTGVGVTLTKLAIVNGNCGAGCDGGGIWNGGTLNIISGTLRSNTGDNKGGGILNAGGASLTVTATTFANNSAPDFGGGGIWNDSALTVSSCTFSGNSGHHGAGIANRSVLTVTNSTFSGNSADGNGGGIYNDGTSSVMHSTLSGNSAWQGGGISNQSGTTTLRSTLVANSSSGGNCSIGGGSTSDGGYNLDSGATCGFATANYSLNNTDPRLASLGNNGGATQTFALRPGSAAIDQIPFGTNGCGTAITSDQRGIARPRGTRCDMGAYEGQANLYLPLIRK